MLRGMTLIIMARDGLALIWSMIILSLESHSRESHIRLVTAQYRDLVSPYLKTEMDLGQVRYPLRAYRV